MCSGGMPVSQPTPLHPGLAPRSAAILLPAPRGKPMIGTSGCLPRSLAHDPPRRLHHPALELLVGGRLPAQVSKICSTSAPASTWPDRYSIDASTSRSISRPKSCGIAIGPQPRVAPGRRALPRHHVGRHRPRRAAKADECRLIGQILPQPRHRLADDARTWAESRPGSSAQVALAAHRVEPRPLALDERAPSGPAHRGTTQDVGEQDRRIEAVAADRLQRHLGRQRRRVAQVEEAAGLAPARRGTRAGSARPAASARSAAATAPRRRTVLRKRR